MIQTTYEFYKTKFNGVIIPDELTFNSHQTKAAAYVDSLCTCKTNLRYEKIVEKCQMAICAVADVLYRQSENDKPQITSETVGNRSRSYAQSGMTDEQYEAEKRQEAETFLSCTGLMYRGL